MNEVFGKWIGEVNRFERQFLEIKNTAHKSGIGGEWA
jgi:hypothetical protein